jgi:ribosomal protein S16
MLAISLMRMGAKKRPFYRVVVKEKRSKRDGKYLENLGTYNPMSDPAEVILKHDRCAAFGNRSEFDKTQPGTKRGRNSGGAADKG